MFADNDSVLVLTPTNATSIKVQENAKVLKQTFKEELQPQWLEAHGLLLSPLVSSLTSSVVKRLS